MIEYFPDVLCGSRKYPPYSPQGRSLEIPRGWASQKEKMFKGKYEDKLEILGGRGFKPKNPSIWGYLLEQRINLIQKMLIISLLLLSLFLQVYFSIQTNVRTAVQYFRAL